MVFMEECESEEVVPKNNELKFRVVFEFRLRLLQTDTDQFDDFLLW